MSKRYPIEPLQSLTRLSLAELNRRAGLHRTRTRERGLSAEQADRAAVACNLSPYDVWPEMLDDQIAASLKACAECSGPFMPERANQRYCGPTCRRTVAQRRYRARKSEADPSFVASVNAARRAYYQQCRTYELARQRRYDAEVRAPRRRAAREAA